MESLIGTSWGVFIGMTVVIMGFAAYMTGHALASTWKPLWHAVVYCGLLGFADRFLTFALFDGKLLSLSGYLIDTAVLVAVSLFAYRLNQAHKMVGQYPWLYEREGLFGWRRKGPRGGSTDM
ncbi:MAG: hypothetical protein OES46_09675 [Gammaproteobacteria bacterium]|jgi:hypothetical protein|nr:hypothetical protein [Gammaproteobacteria bacterium]